MTGKVVISIFLGLALMAFGQEERIEFKGVGFRIYRAEPEKVRLGWKDGRGEILHSLQAAKRHFEKGGTKVKMLTNGGIFEPGCVPSGLLIEKGKVVRPLNLKPGKGNFFLKPNGVFLISKNPVKARVLESSALAKLSPADKSSIEKAVQSGPLLLGGGKIHPAFNEGSPNKLLRNGVGVDREGRVVFAITADKQYCNLWTFASLFKSLGCKDALFLDGDLSRMIVNPGEKVTGQGFASIFAVVE